MKVAFFLTPKNEIVCENIDATMRQVLEKMEYHRYSAIPLIDKEGRYVATITEGDILWELKNKADLTFKETNKIFIKDIPKYVKNRAVSINADIEDLLDLVSNQNFVPVVDDNDVFIGIVKRSDVINYCYKNLVKIESTE
ncbi:CBS domain containing protein [Alkaliphilus metalliredigens QYMF]|uniref:CBS domain containing protein n=1 Tax=Alkaliphilus metalliredigens (strain QYMF) TaxID=293826 RepID=A6TM25_ALKMQ|nr:CBS domain-containing protein [Alkaliphilus metalliredigens]ABR47243.1 CBS domain containing protein [Alkaliphilus metalliredigens QYMF]